ncbi:MAG: Gfo/Idh/MocA family protein [Chloroflexota bacterium]
MARTIGVGVIGMGWMGTVHSRSLRAAGDRFFDQGIRAQLVICADESIARATAAQERFGFTTCTTDWQDVIAHPDVEAISIATPNHLHLEIVRAAAAAGKHVLCEKPVGRSAAETIAAADAARTAGVLSFVGYNYRWAPLVQFARKQIAAGELGRLTHYRGRFLTGYASDPRGVLSWRFQQEYAGWGTLGDLMAHVVDMALMLAGPIQRVTSNHATFLPSRPLATDAGTHFNVGAAAGPQGEVTNEDYVGALVQFAGGAQGTLEACRVITGPDCQMAFEVNGTEGAMHWDFERMNELQVQRPARVGGTGGFTRILSAPEHPFHARFAPGPGIGLGYDDLKTIEAAQFLLSIQEGRQGEPGLHDAAKVARVLDAMARSWSNERWEDIAVIGGD